MREIEMFLDWLNHYLWGPPMLVLLFGTHIFLTVRLRLIQRFVPLGIKISLTRSSEGEGDVSQFGALTTALAATIGTGNIIGVATAVALGGPGAVLWTWLTGVFGIATKYSEALLGVKYRVKTSDGTMLGGPMCALEHGLGMKWAGVVFALFTAIAAFGIGNMVQSNAVSTMASEVAKVPPWASGILLTVLTGVVILGGIKSIARVCERLVPFMAAFYMLGCAVILFMGASTIPGTIVLIVKSAFTGQAAAGGFIGAAIMTTIRHGVSKGMFSNESGLGSAAIVAAAARTRNPVRQALVSSTGTFWDTVVVCAMTGLVLVNTGAWQYGLEAPALTRAAFDSIPVVGPPMLTFALFVFVLSTILGWSYYGERAVEYLFGKSSIRPYRWAWVIFVMLGSMTSVPLVWQFADAANALMAIPNLAALLLLSGVVLADTRRYLWEANLDDGSIRAVRPDETDSVLSPGRQ